MKSLPIVISAPSGAGKGTVIPLVLEALESACYSVSCTTRAPRPGEVDGVNYYFITREQFCERIEKDEMLEYNEYVGNLYGTPLRETKEKLAAGYDVIFEVDVHGAANIRRLMPEAVTIMIMPPDFETLKKRLTDRGTDTPEAIEGRLHTALDEARCLPDFDYFVVNEQGKIEECAAKIKGIIEAERMRCSRYPDTVNNFKRGISLI